MRSIKLLTAASVGAAMIFASGAQAAVEISFTPGASSPPAGSVVICDFDSTTCDVTTGPLVQIKTPPADGNGAPPANSTYPGSAYLSVLGGGQADIMFGSAVSGFSFDWGSIDAYNTLTLFTTDGSETIIPGSSFITPANGDQVAPGTNGLFSATGTDGTQFLGFRLNSSQNSFEIDNVAAVPEPATWAMMLFGFGAVGFGMRRRRGKEKLRVRYAL